MLCKNCGNEITPNMKFCPECGMKFEKAEETDTQKIEKNVQEKTNDSTSVNENNISKQDENSTNDINNVIVKKPQRPFMRFLGKVLIPLSLVFLAISAVYILEIVNNCNQVKNSYYSDITDSDWKIIYRGMSKDASKEERSKAQELNQKYKDNRNPGIYSRLIDNVTIREDPYKYKSFDEYYKASKNTISEYVAERYSFMNIYIFCLVGIGLFIAGIVCKKAYKEGQKLI